MGRSRQGVAGARWAWAVTFGAVAVGCGSEPASAPSGEGFHAAAQGWELRRSRFDARVTASAGVTVSPAGGAGATFRTAAVTGVAFARGTDALEAGGVVAIDHGDVVERARVRDEGVEQTWTFARRPRAGVTVRVRVEGMRYARSTAAGHHFTEGERGRGVVYGPATWVDAEGRRAAVAARWTGDAIEMTVPGALVAASAFPAVLDPVIGPEVALDPRVHVRPEVTHRSPATVAFNGTTGLIAWCDARPGRRLEIRVERLSATGEHLTPGGFAIAPVAVDGTMPSVASNGSDFLVVWPSSAARVAADGRVLSVGASPTGTNDSASRGAELYYRSAAVARDGDGYVAAWGDGAVHVAWLDASGAPRSPAPLTLGGVSGRRASIATAASGHLVVWESSGDIRMARVGRDGSVLDPGGRPVTVATAGRVAPVVTSDGTNYLVGWYAQTASGSRLAGAYYELLSPAAEPIGSAATYLGPAPADGTLEPPRTVSVGYDGAQYIATRGPIAARVARDGALLDPSGRSLGLAAASTRVRWSASIAPPLFTMGEQSVAFGADLSPRAPQYYSTSGNFQTAPRVASNGRDYFVVWRDLYGASAANGARASGVRVSASGAVLDAPPLDLDDTAGTSETLPEMLPGVVFNGGAYLTSSTGLRVVGADGMFVGARVPPPSLTTRLRLVAASGSVGLLASTGPTPGVWRVRADGTALDPGPITAPFIPRAAASNGAGFFVVGTEGATPSTMLAERLNADGDVLDTPPLRFTCATGCFSPSAAYDGANYLLAWVELRQGAPDRGDVWARRVSPAGVALDAPRRVSPDTARATSVVVTYDGRDFVVAWDDTAVGAGDIFAARVGHDGAPIDATPVTVAASPAAETSPALGADGAGHTLVAYERYDEALSAKRVMTRVIDLSPDGGIPDGGVIDAGVTDTGAVTDVGAVVDAGAMVDTGATVDAGVTDVVVSDASTADVSVEDSGAIDASAPRDVAFVDVANDTTTATDRPDVPAPITDAGAPDVAMADAGTSAPPDEGGGLCDARPGSTGRAGDGATLGGLAALALVRRRRRA